MSWVSSPLLALRASRVALVAAALGVVWAAGQFFREPVRAVAAPPGSLIVSHAGVAAPVATDAELSRAIATDLFAADRAAPAVRYRIERATVGVTVAPPPVRLVGTVIAAGGRSFAMCQLGAERPRVVYPGQRIGAMKLESVAQGSATFTDAAGVRVMLRVARAGESR